MHLTSHTRTPHRYTPGVVILRPGMDGHRAIKLHRIRTGWAGPVEVIKC